MPELPEVETVVRQLADSLPGHRIEEVEIIHSDLLLESPQAFRQALVGSTIESVDRRGKNILLHLSQHNVLVVNLGMTGRVLFQSPEAGFSGIEAEEAPSHLALVFTLAPPASLLYADPRRFGSIRRFASEEWMKESARLGPEPLDPGLTGETLRQTLAKSRSPIRSWLLDQTRIAGIGNIYASEALFRAGVHPTRPARSLSEDESGQLLKAIRGVLSDAIRARGTTLRDYRTASGDRGGFEPFLQAYGRAGSPCTQCKTPIVRAVFGNRSAFFCPSCQPNP